MSDDLRALLLFAGWVVFLAIVAGMGRYAYLYVFGGAS